MTHHISLSLSPIAEPFHLMWSDGEVLCHVASTPRVWKWPWTATMLSWPEACSECTHIYRSGYNQHRQALTAAAPIAA
jgi:hypothetical protein